MKALNDNETLVLDALKANADFYGEDGQYVLDECDFGSLTKSQVKGYLSQLQSKGCIVCFNDGESYFDGYVLNHG